MKPAKAERIDTAAKFTWEIAMNIIQELPVEAVDDRGEITDLSTDSTKALDNLARLFCMGQYTSVVKHVDYNSIYVAFPVNVEQPDKSVKKKKAKNKIKLDLDDGELDSFKTLLSNEAPIEAIRDELFQRAHSYKNWFIDNMVKQQKFLLKKWKAEELIDKEQHDAAVKELDDISSNYFKGFKAKYADLFLTAEEVKSIIPFKDSLFVKIPAKVEYNNVHTEARGVHYISSTKTLPETGSDKDYIIGLGKGAPLSKTTGPTKDVGCCGGCTKEFEILTTRGYTIQRSGDIPENLPVGLYKPSPNITLEEYKQFSTPKGKQIKIEGYDATSSASHEEQKQPGHKKVEKTKKPQSNDYKIASEHFLECIKTLEKIDIKGTNLQIQKTGDKEIQYSYTSGNSSPKDKSIIRELKFLAAEKDMVIKVFGTGGNHSGKGLFSTDESNYWHTYAKVAMSELLQLRLKSTGIDEDIETFSPNYIFDNSSASALRLAKDIAVKTGDKLLVNLNLYGKHWVGILIDKTADEVKVHYMDSEQQSIPDLLKEMLVKALAMTNPERQINIAETELEPQKYNNCGPEVIENFMQYLTGYRLSQEDAVPVHALLFEDTIMLAGDC